MEDNVHMLLEGTIAELIINLVQPERKANALCTIKKGRILQATLLFWKLLSTTLQEWGFMISNYNHGIENKIINGK